MDFSDQHDAAEIDAQRAEAEREGLEEIADEFTACRLTTAHLPHLPCPGVTLDEHPDRPTGIPAWML